MVSGLEANRRLIGSLLVLRTEDQRLTSKTVNREPSRRFQAVTGEHSLATAGSRGTNGDGLEANRRLIGSLLVLRTEDQRLTSKTVNREPSRRFQAHYGSVVGL
jgi:uncharacterized protein YjiK